MIKDLLNSLFKSVGQKNAIDGAVEKIVSESKKRETLTVDISGPIRIWSDGAFIEAGTNFPKQIEKLIENPTIKRDLSTFWLDLQSRFSREWERIYIDGDIDKDGFIYIETPSSDVFAINSVYFDYVIARFPNAHFHVKDPVSPIIITSNDIISAAIMPMETRSNTRSEAQVEAETKTFAETKAKAEAGDAEAQTNLGAMYYNGQGVEQDFKEAIKWFQKAADLGFSNAQSNLGMMYERGQGLEQDFKEAVKWYQKAAKQGDVGAQFNLGVMWENGEGFTEDYVNACAWYNIAAANGDEGANKNKGSIAKRMTAEEITKAEELVKEMVKKNPKLIN